MGKHLMVKVHIAKLNKLTESKVTEWTSWIVDETALVIPKRQGSWGIPIVSLQRKFIFDILVWFILKQHNVRINKVFAMRPGLAKKIEKVRISTYFEYPETNHHITENAWCIDNTDSWLSKRVHWHSIGESVNRGTTFDGCDYTVALDTGSAWAGLPITSIQMRVTQESKIHWQLAAPLNSRWMDLRQVHHGSVKAIPALDALDVEKA